LENAQKAAEKCLFCPHVVVPVSNLVLRVCLAAGIIYLLLLSTPALEGRGMYALRGNRPLEFGRLQNQYSTQNLINKYIRSKKLLS